MDWYLETDVIRKWWAEEKKKEQEISLIPRLVAQVRDLAARVDRLEREQGELK